MAAKFVVKKHKALMGVEPMGVADLDNMRLVLRLKLEAHPALRRQLLATGAARLVEDCTGHPHGSGPSGGRSCGRAGGSGRTGWGGSGSTCALPSANRAEPDAVGLSDWTGEMDRARRSG